MIPARNLSTARSPNCSSSRRRFRPTIAASATSAARRSRRPGTRPRPTRRSRVPAYVVSRLNELATCKGDAANRPELLREFCRRFAERAFRRPLTDEQKQLYVDRQFDGGDGRRDGGQRGRAAGAQVAAVPVSGVRRRRVRRLRRGSRLSFGLWDSLPDQALLDAAATASWSSREQVTRRPSGCWPICGPARSSREFFLQWLKVDQCPTSPRTRSGFPSSRRDRGRPADLARTVPGRRRLERRVRLPPVAVRPTAVPQRPAGEVLRRRAARGRAVPEGDAGRRASGPACCRIPYLMAGFAYTATSSPIHRGVFISRSVLGRIVATAAGGRRAAGRRPAPGSDDPRARGAADQARGVPDLPRDDQPAGLHPGTSTPSADVREEQGRPIDATGAYLTRSGETGERSRASRELGRVPGGAATRRTTRSSSNCSITWSSSRSERTVPQTAGRNCDKSFAERRVSTSASCMVEIESSRVARHLRRPTCDKPRPQRPASH